MRGSWRAGLSSLGTAMMLSKVGLVSGHSQLVMEQTFYMETSSCEGVSCRKEIIGANETLGVGAIEDCSHNTTYWHEDLDQRLPAPNGKQLFELVYSCRKHGPDGEEVVLTSLEECGMVAEPCVDAGTNPGISEVTYQVAFEFEEQSYDVSVDVKLYFNYLKAGDKFHAKRSENAVRCVLSETCHRRCESGEWSFPAELRDSMGDGWNAGGINLFDHFRLESRSELMAEVSAMMSSDEANTAAATAAAARRTSYLNTMLGGSARTVPLCLSDGEYLFSTQFHTPGPGDSSHAFDVAGRLFSESTWTFCGHEGTLADYTHVRVAGGLCTPIADWGETAAPSTTPFLGATPVPTPAPGTGTGTGGGGGGGDGGSTTTDSTTDGAGDNDDEKNRSVGGGDSDDRGSGSGSSSGNSLTDLQIFAIGFGALALAGVAAAGGTYAQNNG
ncbi:unnamed protein product, partial [Ectocarpus sp. 4 AP-2014]